LIDNVKKAINMGAESRKEEETDYESKDGIWH
jgi:hypothetical protein